MDVSYSLRRYLHYIHLSLNQFKPATQFFVYFLAMVLYVGYKHINCPKGIHIYCIYIYICVCVYEEFRCKSL